MHTDRYDGSMSGMNASYSDMGSIKENIETNELPMPDRNALYDDMEKPNALYQELCWDHDDELVFTHDGKRVIVYNKTKHETH